MHSVVARISLGKGQFSGSYFRHSEVKTYGHAQTCRFKYSQPYSLGAAAMRLWLPVYCSKFLFITGNTCKYNLTFSTQPSGLTLGFVMHLVLLIITLSLSVGPQHSLERSIAMIIFARLSVCRRRAYLRNYTSDCLIFCACCYGSGLVLLEQCSQQTRNNVQYPIDTVGLHE